MAKQVKKIVAKENNYFSEKTGFIPKTPKKEIIKHFARIIADKKLDDIIPNENTTIAFNIPVWPLRYKDKDLKYYKKDGKWKISFMSGVLLKQDDDMGYHNVPNREDFINDDFDEFHSQFLVIKTSGSKAIVPGQIAFLHPRSTKIGVNFFKYKGETLAVINTMNLMFSEEV